MVPHPQMGGGGDELTLCGSGFYNTELFITILSKLSLKPSKDNGKSGVSLKGMSPFCFLTSSKFLIFLFIVM